MLLAADYRAGTVLWVVAILLWIVLTYTIFAGFTIKERKPTLDQGISGAWLLAVVATQSIAVLSALLAAHIGQPGKLEMNFLALSMWLWGGMLYIWMMSLIFYRYTFFPFSPGDLSPPYWINMGAMAISTLAGSLLIINAPDAPFLLSLLPFIKGFTVFYWATGTWWIPMLVVLAVWRHVYQALPDEIRSALLGRGLSPRHVCGRHRRDDRSDGIRFPRVPAAGFSVHRACRVDGGICRTCPRPVAPHPRISILDARATGRRRRQPSHC